MKCSWLDLGVLGLRARSAWKVLLALSLLVLLLGGIGLVAVRGNGGYQIQRWTVSGSRATGSGGSYVLQSSVGQAEVGTGSGGGYALSGGFAPGGAAQQPYEVYIPLVLR